MSRAQPPADRNRTYVRATGLSSLLESLSHDLRILLATILGWTECLVEGTADPQQQQEGIRHIRSAAESMLQLLDEYSELFRFEEAEGLAAEAADLRGVLGRICQALELVARARQQMLLMEVEEAASSVRISPTVRQAMWLTVYHALRALPEGATVRIRFEPAGQVVIESTQALYENVKTSGLRLARLLTEREGGRLAVESQDTGMRITFQLPGFVASPTAVPAASHTPDKSESAPPLAPHAKKVLVIDDDENLLKLLEKVVSAAGYCPYLATSGAQGLETARATAPDVVLLDIGMPGMDGFATFNVLRAEPALAKAKIVALTAYTGAAERERIALHGFDGFIPKPFRREQLLQVLSELLV